MKNVLSEDANPRQPTTTLQRYSREVRMLLGAPGGTGHTLLITATLANLHMMELAVHDLLCRMSLKTQAISSELKTLQQESRSLDVAIAGSSDTGIKNALAPQEDLLHHEIFHPRILQIIKVEALPALAPLFLHRLRIRATLQDRRM